MSLPEKGPNLDLLLGQRAGSVTDVSVIEVSMGKHFGTIILLVFISLKKRIGLAVELKS